MSFKSFSLVALLAVATLAGCSKGPQKPDDLPNLNPTTIVVKYDDGTPVADANVMLRLAQSTGGRTWNLTGVTDATGSLELMTDGNWAGAPAGEYQAAVTKEVPITEESGEAGAAPKLLGVTREVATVYNNPNTSGLTAVIEEGKTNVIELNVGEKVEEEGAVLWFPASKIALSLNATIAFGPASTPLRIKKSRDRKLL